MSHPQGAGSPKPGTGVSSPQTADWKASTNRGAGTASIENASDAVGSGVKPSNQPMLASDGPDHPTPTASPAPGTGAAGPQPTAVPVDYTGTKSPTQNQRTPDGGVPVTAALGPTPK